jgi:NTE family protein
MRPPELCVPCAAPRSGIKVLCGVAGDLRTGFQRFVLWLGLACALAGALALGGCESVYNLPANRPLLSPVQVHDLGMPDPNPADDALLILSFSGGGTRAAAFSFGVLKELERSRAGARQSLLDRVDFVSGVSGGAITAAYFSLKNRAALSDFRERFLIRNAEENLNTSVNLANIGRALSGGVNASQFPRWLDDNLFDGATFDAFSDGRKPRLWINASDIYNHTPFVFGPVAFDAMCSDVRSYRIADAVAASAAVPVAFAPVVLETFPGGCSTPLPEWIERARKNREAPPLLRTFAQATGRYHDGSMKYVKLLDGGLVDNFGLSGFSIAILSGQRAYDPMTEAQAVRVRRIMFLVVDAGRSLSGDWINSLEGPIGTELVSAAADTAIDASVRSSYTAFSALLAQWTAKVRTWRCSLSLADRTRLGLPADWKCGDLRTFVDRLSFERLEPERAAALEKVPTRLKLPADQVDLTIESGGLALRGSKTFQNFRNGI